eukprot:CAMPEP_0178965362 /NCGR_PEP_ID=MMETSP0789-20121207/16238_1 /TAXON_ID=3005 /ORGANISM="Rhizosolenia setigera, Strain CCMP 1694" /LENGTH=93 /DNA_ID=CAMNT_0020650335 /DNA_START=80 /DNA_END=361 /DNA_ORIENTATION=+
MPFTTGLLGGITGTSLMMLTNSLRKIPLSRQPWGHVLCFVGGAYTANYWKATEIQLVHDINEIRADKGLPPMVGSELYSAARTRYIKPEDLKN